LLAKRQAETALNNKAEDEGRLKMKKKVVIFVSVCLSVFLIAVYLYPPQAREDGTKFLEAGMRKVYNDPEFRKKAKSMEQDMTSASTGYNKLRATTNRVSQLAAAEASELN
jgi:hypothetical protein